MNFIPFSKTDMRRSHCVPFLFFHQNQFSPRTHLFGKSVQRNSVNKLNSKFIWLLLYFSFIYIFFCLIKITSIFYIFFILMFHHQIVIFSVYYLFSVCNCKIIKLIMYHSLVIFSHNIVKIRSNVLSEPIHKLQLS